jgi:hypothetical protein
VPPSLSVWVQRAGRGGRDPSIQAVAVLLVEKSVMEKKEVEEEAVDEIGPGERETLNRDVDDSEDLPDLIDLPRREEDLEIVVNELPKKEKRIKKVEEGLKLYISETHCRRDVCDQVFDNPSPRKREFFFYLSYLSGFSKLDSLAPTGICCDLCHSRLQRRNYISRPGGSQDIDDAEELDSGDDYEPAKTRKPARFPRRKTHFYQAARTSLLRWRISAWSRDYSDGGFPENLLMSDKLITSISRSQKVTQLSDFDLIAPYWKLASTKNGLGTTYGEEVLAVLKGVDDAEYERRSVEKERKKTGKQKKRAAEALNNPPAPKRQRTNPNNNRRPLANATNTPLRPLLPATSTDRLPTSGAPGLPSIPNPAPPSPANATHYIFHNHTPHTPTVAPAYMPYIRDPNPTPNQSSLSQSVFTFMTLSTPSDFYS